jgi:hypothetical protein
MAKQVIGIGAVANDGNGDTLRDAFDKTNDNFDELYDEVLGYTAENIANKATSFTTLNDTLYPSVQAVENRVQAAIAGLKWKDAVRVATDVAGTLATSFENGDTVDGVVLATGDRILIKNQVAQTENGIYIVAASGAPTRSTDADLAAEIEGATVTVLLGTANANTTWTQITPSLTIGVSNIIWNQFGASVPAASDTTPGTVELATNTEMITGTDTVRAATPAGARAAYPSGLAAVDVSGTAIAFAVPQFYGTPGAPESGNITLNATGLVKGMVQLLYHDNGTEPTYPSEFVKLSGTYSTTVLNIIYMMAISASRIEYTISQEA